MFTRIHVMLPLALAAMMIAAPCSAQDAKGPIKRYLGSPGDETLVRATDRNPRDITNILPERRPKSFAEYIRAKFPVEFNKAVLRQAVESQRLNKLIGNTATGGGTTSLVSRVAVPGVFGFASEYGAITQKTSGNTTTLRTNLLGLVNLVAGEEQFPSCPDAADGKNCQPASRWLRRFSGSTSFESVAGDDTSSGASPPASSPTFSDLLGDDFRLSSWSVRFDWTANDPDNPKYVAAWQKAITSLRDTDAAELTEAVSALFASSEGVVFDAYIEWRAMAVAHLQRASAADFANVLETELDALIVRMSTADKDFWDRVVAVKRTHEAFAAQRDAVLKAIQSHQFSSEYVERRPADQPTLSTARLVYSHQPSARRPVLLTFNGAVTWYTHKPVVIDAGTVATDVGQLRDVQISGQIDRRLGPELRHSVFTIGAYYQWMADDALIKFDPDTNTAPGTGIVLTKAAQKVLTSKGSIGVVQFKLTVPITDVIKVPVSFTWSNRTELVTALEKKSALKAQIGFTVDLDGLLKGK